MSGEGVTDRPIGSRRGLLLAAGSTLAATAGCLNRFRRTAEREEPSPVSVEISALPDDEDPHVIRIANHLADMLRIAGITVDVIPRRHDVFRRQTLINQNFDIYVGRQSAKRDPDYLRPLLHSRFVDEPGEQNPFGYANSMVDQLLRDQLIEEGSRREATLAELQQAITEERPFIPIAFDQDHRLSRPDRVRIPSGIPPDTASWLLSLRRGDEPSSDDPSCRFGSTDERLTHNLNPIAVEYRGGNGVVETIYEPAVRRWAGEYVPWLADRWEWTSPVGASAPTVELQLQEDLHWHDDEPVTADDVVFSYRFLADTTMSDDDPIVPAPRFRGRTSIIDSVQAVDDLTVRVQFEPSSPSIAQHVLTLPILPEHVWENHTNLTDVAGITITDATTEALVIDNLDPVGSGPFRVTDVSGDDLLELTWDEDHFSWDESFRLALDLEATLTDFERLRVDVRPSASNIADSIREGGLDTSLTGLGREHAEANDETELHVSDTGQLIHVGFNVREFPLSVHGFRNAIARLLDRHYLIEEVFQGGAQPTLSPVFDTDLVPDELRWTGPGSATFAGDPGSGEIDEEEAKAGFRDAGFQYSADGDLLSG